LHLLKHGNEERIDVIKLRSRRDNDVQVLELNLKTNQSYDLAHRRRIGWLR
jgi:hypothetical protein